MNKRLSGVLVGMALGLGASSVFATTPAQVLTTYANIAEAAYSDSVASAIQLKAKIDALLESPTEANLEAARQAWRDARVPYMQTEVYRFGNEIVDEWEGRVNAWPLDEGLIDYVSVEHYGEESDENPFYAANIIANQTLVLGNQKKMRQKSQQSF